ncbi:MAG: glycosyl transferase family protein [Cyanobacteria bacterium RYN_339]|nr:glycosyl transferase family protein [Cyanobacteria bacterium RYN_339]
MPPDLSILIVNWNTRELLLACLRSITAPAEIVVVDNASHDGSADAVATEFPGVTLIRNDRNVGFAAANNQAYQACRGRYALLLNSDTLVPPGSLERLTAYMAAHPRVGIVGPRLEYGDGSYQISALRFSRPWDVYYEYARFPRLLQPAAQKAPRRLIPLSETEPTPVEYVMGAALLIRREAVDAIGLMDDAYFMYAEEVDWCFRARAAGWEIMYLPTAVITHLGGQSTAQVPDLMLAYRFASTLRFMRLHYGPAATLGTRALLTVAAIQNTLLALAFRLAGRESQEGWRAERRRNGVVLRTALAGTVPHALQPSLES